MSMRVSIEEFTEGCEDAVVKVGEVRPFPGLEPDKAQALKPLEEAAEVFGAWQEWQRAHTEGDCGYGKETDPIDCILWELADTIQACVNLAASLGCDDLTRHLDRVRRHNMWRGRYETQTKERAVDVDALLALADEIERAGYNSWLHSGDFEQEAIAASIRRACGEVE